MDNNFQTSFIPKKPLAEETVVRTRRGGSLFGFIATIIFFTAIASGVGVYFYKQTLTRNIASMSTQLDAARNSFEPTLISELQVIDRRIDATRQILDNHISVTPVFAALQESTLKTVQFTSFSYALPASNTDPITIKMDGKAKDYTSIALQSDAFVKNKNIKNPIFAELKIEEGTGNIMFVLSFDVSPDLVRFKNSLTAPNPVDTSNVLETSQNNPFDPISNNTGATPDTSGTQGSGNQTGGGTGTSPGANQSIEI